MWYLIVSIPDLCILTYFDSGELKEISHCDSKKIHVEFAFLSQYFTKTNNIANDWCMKSKYYMVLSMSFCNLLTKITSSKTLLVNLGSYFIISH